MKKIFPVLAFLVTGIALPRAGQAQQTMKHAVAGRPQARTVSLDISPNLQLRRDPLTGLTTLLLEEGFASMDKGAPDLPHFSHAFITGDTMITAVGFGPHQDYLDVEIAPSKGPISRLVDPRSVPALPGPLYQQDKFYPETPYEWGVPYQVRGIRGRSLSITPVQYNPVRKILRVYQSLSLTMYSSGVAMAEGGSPEWNSLLRGRFLNADAVLQSGGSLKTTNYTPALESGSMLIVAPDKYRIALQPFMRWKAARGIRSWLVNTDTIAGGANPVSIKAIVAAQHSLHNIDFVLFVGSPAEVPVVSDPAVVAGASYAAYSYLNGNDHYPDLLTGVFSVNNEQQLQTLVDRSIRYEREPAMGADWYGRAIGIASDQGPGDDNEMDYEHMRNLRSQLMQSGYTAIGEYYDGSQGGLDAPGDPAPQDIVSAINARAGLMNYCGHGWEAGLGTSGFSIQNLPQLTNNNGELPFLMTVACNTGDFTVGECLGQAITRKTGSNGATGAVAAFCSSISQYWNQPMEAQDEVVKIISGSGPRVYSIGAITACGVMQMNDAYGSSGEDMADTWILFGDPSLQLRSRQPDTFQVSHLASIDRGTTNFNVSVANNPLATVVLLYHDSILSVKHRAANAPMTQHSFPALQEGDSFQVWVTAPNARPYSRWVRVTARTAVENSSATSWAVYPQPANETLTIRGADKGSYVLYDAAGRRVTGGSLGNGKTVISVGNLPAGSYLLEIWSAAGEAVHQQVQVAR